MRREQTVVSGRQEVIPGAAVPERVDWRKAMGPELFRDLAVMRLEFSLRAEEAVELPSFLGSTLRGAFGHALKLSACQSSGTPCESCRIPQSCWYGWLFETVSPEGGSVLAASQDAPRPFILTPPIEGQVGAGRRLRRGEVITFSMSLLGSGINGLPYAVYSIEEMARGGLGVRRGLFSLQEVFCVDGGGRRVSLGYEAQSRRIDLMRSEVATLEDLVAARRAELPEQIERLKVSFLTRARLRVGGSPRESIDFAEFVKFLWRRVSMLLEVHGSGHPPLDRNGMMKDADSIQSLAAATIRHEVWRSSNRQRRRLHHDGLLGEIVFEGRLLNQFLPLLLAGEVLHVGSGATFGLGKYQVTT